MYQASRKVTLEDWIKEALIDPDKDGACSAISLVHMVATNLGTHSEEIHTVKFGDKGYDPNALGALFKHKATTYAQDMKGPQTFQLLAFYGERSDPQGKHPFVVAGETQFEGLATENPTETGKTAQTMRLMEAIVQGSFRQNSITFDTVIRALDSQSRQMAAVMDQNWQMMEMLKMAIMDRAKNEHEYKISEMNHQMIGKMLGYLPGLTNSILGKEVFPESTADSALIDSMVSDLTPEKIQKLQEVIPPQAWPMVANRLRAALEKKKTEAMAAEKPNGKGTQELS